MVAGDLEVLKAHSIEQEGRIARLEAQVAELIAQVEQALAAAEFRAAPIVTAVQIGEFESTSARGVEAAQACVQYRIGEASAVTCRMVLRLAGGIDSPLVGQEPGTIAFSCLGESRIGEALPDCWR